MKFRTIFAHFFIFVFLFVSVVWLSPNQNIVYASISNAVIKDATAAIAAPTEETEWRFRYLDGKLQKRLWSITYGKWLTDWEWA